MKIDFALVWLCLFRCLIIEVEGASISSYKPMYSKFFRPQRSWSVVDPIVSLFKAIFGSQKDRVEYVHIKPVKRKRVTKVDKLQMELESLLQDPPEYCAVKSVSHDMREWVLLLIGPNSSIYEGEVFQLKMRFPFDYPYKPPSAYFIKQRYDKFIVPHSNSITEGSRNDTSIAAGVSNIPIHPHIYSNGDICLSILGLDWRPSMKSESIIISILSMLTSTKSKKAPIDNLLHSQYNAPGQQQINWQYHDNNC